MNIKASMNRGLSDKLIKEFTNLFPIIRPKIPNQIVPDPYWIAGFTSGEGCLMVRVRNSSTNLTGYRVELVFQITQHIRDELLMESLIYYFKTGKCYNKNKALDFKVSKIEDLANIIIPFFHKYPM